MRHARRGGVVLAVLVVVATLQLSAGASQAEESSWEVRPEVVTDIPIQVGAGLLVEGPLRLRGRTSLGVLPHRYVNLSNDILVPVFEEYDEDAAALVESALQESLVWRAHLGWRPFRGTGLYIHGGYTLVSLGGNATPAEVVEGVSDRSLPDRRSSGSVERQVDINSTLHLLDVELGWEWRFWERLAVRTAVGWSFTVASTAQLEAQFEAPGAAGQRAINEFERAGEAYLNDTYRRYIHPPSVTVAIGWTF